MISSEHDEKVPPVRLSDRSESSEVREWLFGPSLPATHGGVE